MLTGQCCSVKHMWRRHGGRGMAIGGGGTAVAAWLLAAAARRPLPTERGGLIGRSQLQPCLQPAHVTWVSRQFLFHVQWAYVGTGFYVDMGHPPQRIAHVPAQHRAASAPSYGAPVQLQPSKPASLQQEPSVTVPIALDS